jgi:uncharacterized membrane protein (DUF106 family)
MFFAKSFDATPLDESTELMYEIMQNMALNEAEEDEFDESALLEGANIDITKKFIPLRKEFKTELKAAKKAYKDDDKDALLKHIKNAKDVIGRMKKEINNMKSDEGSVFFGYLIDRFLALGWWSIPITLAAIGLKYSATADKHVENANSKAGIYFDKKEYNKAKKYHDAEYAKAKAADTKYIVVSSASIGTIVSAFMMDMKKLGEIQQKQRQEAKKGQSPENIRNLYRNRLLLLIDKYEKLLSEVERSIK